MKKTPVIIKNNQESCTGRSIDGSKDQFLTRDWRSIELNYDVTHLWQFVSESPDLKRLKTNSSLSFTLKIIKKKSIKSFLITSSILETQIWKTPDIPKPDDFSSHGEDKFHLVGPFLPWLKPFFWNSFTECRVCVGRPPLCFLSHDLAAHIYHIQHACELQIMDAYR